MPNIIALLQTALASHVLRERQPNPDASSSADELAELRRQNELLLKEQSSLEAVNAELHDQVYRKDAALGSLQDLVQSHENDITAIKGEMKVLAERKEAALEKARKAEEVAGNVKISAQKLARDLSKGAADTFACLIKVLGKVGGEPNPLPPSSGLLLPDTFFGCLKGELGDLPNFFDNVGTFAAGASCFALLDCSRKKDVIISSTWGVPVMMSATSTM